MTTHFHAMVTTPRANLSEFMQQWEGEYARYFNWRHGLVGHLFGGPFRRVIIENDLHLFTAAAYIFNNPVAAGVVSRPEDWKWSSYAATVGLAPVPAFLSTEWIETLFPADSLSASQQLLRRCMADPQPVISFLEATDPTSPAAVRSFIVDRLKSLRHPCSYRMLTRPPLEALFAQMQTRSQLADAICLAHETYGYKLAEIAPCVALHPATVSKIYCLGRRTRQAADGRLRVGTIA